MDRGRVMLSVSQVKRELVSDDEDAHNSTHGNRSGGVKKRKGRHKKTNSCDVKVNVLKTEDSNFRIPTHPVDSIFMPENKLNVLKACKVEPGVVVENVFGISSLGAQVSKENQQSLDNSTIIQTPRQPEVFNGSSLDQPLTKDLADQCSTPESECGIQQQKSDQSLNQKSFGGSQEVLGVRTDPVCEETRKPRESQKKRSSTGRRKHCCETCNKSFPTPSTLKTHIRTHTAEKPFQCKLCPKAFSQKAHLIVHMRRHSGERPYCCDYCQKSFIIKGRLTRHLRIHTGERPYICSLCPRQFITKSDLVLHTKKHLGEKPFSCDICQKSFVQRWGLNKHMKSHSDRRFGCESCDKRFLHKCDLVYHQRIHTGENLNSCPFCEKAFVRPSDLKRHIRTHTGEKPLSCDICSKQFHQSSHLQYHMTTHHKENTD